MNIHHLELFYYVARHQGISLAIQNMPYGIQQPAVSGQILQLEKSLGIQLFQRRPFALTPAGHELYQFIIPFFANLNHISEKLRDGIDQHLRLAASATVFRDHVPDLLEILRKQYPKLKLTLREANQIGAEILLQNQEIDLAISVLEEKLSSGIQSHSLLRLPLILLVHQKSKFRSATELFQSLKNMDQTLIALPKNTVLNKIFQEELQRRKIVWSPQIEVDSLDLIYTYVSRGFGIGLSLAVPRMPRRREVRSLPLHGFSSLQISAFWKGKLSSVTQFFLELIKKRAQLLASEISMHDIIT